MNRRHRTRREWRRGGGRALVSLTVLPSPSPVSVAPRHTMVADFCYVRDFSCGASIAVDHGMRRAASFVVVLAALAAPAHADGFYYGQSYGISSARSDGRSMLGESLQLRVQLGWRWGHWSVGPWFAGHLAA